MNCSPNYGWYDDNAGDRIWPVGSLKPNDFGLSDMYGNVYEWCMDRYAAKPNSNVDVEKELSEVADDETRVARGGAFYYRLRYLRSAHRSHHAPHLPRLYVLGFRVARTCSSE